MAFTQEVQYQEYSWPLERKCSQLLDHPNEILISSGGRAGGRADKLTVPSVWFPRWTVNLRGLSSSRIPESSPGFRKD